MIVLMPMLPLMLRWLDVRLAVGGGLLVLALSAYIETGLSPCRRATRSWPRS